MSNSIRVMAAPYGTQLDPLATRMGMPEIADPASILTNDHTRNANIDIALRSIEAGASVAATNTFRLRHADRNIYQRAAIAHTYALIEAISLSCTSDLLRVMPVGPAAIDCYDPSTSPDRKEAYDLHRFQADVARVNNLDAILYETLATVREALAAAQAIRDADMPGYISFVVGHDGNLLSGESPRDAIHAVLVETRAQGVRAFGFNCCPIEAIPRALDRCSEHSNRVKLVYPNASSYPQRELEGKAEKGEVKGVIDRNGVAQFLNGLAVNRGLEIIGGCCGFEIDDIAAIVDAVRTGRTQTQLPRTDFSQ